MVQSRFLAMTVAVIMIMLYTILGLFLPTVTRVGKDATYTGIIVVGVGVTCEYTVQTWMHAGVYT